VLPAGHFDIATVFGVFEHIYDPNRFLSVIHKILKPGAFLYMAIPTVFYIHSGSIARSHTCLYSKNTLTQILEANGFKILNTNEPGLGGIFYNRTEIFASKDSPAAGYKFHAGDSYLRIKSKLNWRIFSGHFEWLFMFFPSILKKKHPRIYSFARAVYRFFKPKKESLDD
jgi:SAM-dependent methyltransferase